MASSNPSPLMVQALESTLDELRTEFDGVFSAETIRRYLDDAFAAFQERSTTGPNAYVVIACRFAREQLGALAQAEGLVAKTMPEVLFVCEHNAGRSQMAAAFTHHLSHGRVGVRSAGSHPDEQVFPLVAQAMTEVGVDVTHEFPKPLTDEVVRAADAVITMGCGDACPIYPGKHYEDWDLADPAGQSLDGVRAIRDEIRSHVEELIARLTMEVPNEAEPEPLAESAAPPTGVGTPSRWNRLFKRSR